jgi:DNA repair exonuclease SbcCD ATPase subunit
VPAEASLPTEEPNFLAHAFKSQYNLIGLVTALGFAALSVSLFPVVFAAGVELIVLPLVSGNPRFQRLVRARVSQDEDQAAAQRTQKEAWEMLKDLPGPEQQRYRALQGLASEIRQNYKALDSSSQMLVEELVRKLDFLLSFYLRMRYSLMRYHAYFSTTDPERMQERIAMLEHEMTAGPERVQQIKARTRLVLEKRLERYRKALENRQLVEAQTETVEEVLQLLRDQSYSMRDPRTITEQLDGLVSSAEDTERGVRDLEELMSIEKDALLPAGDDIEAELEAGRSASSRAAEASPIPRLREVPPPAASAPPRKKISQ